MNQNFFRKIGAYFGIAAMLFVTAFLLSANLQKKAHAYPADSQLDVWWPTDNAVVHGVQPFKAMLKDRSLDTYSMFWQVDNDRLNQMDNNYNDYPHKEAIVDLSGWSWHSNGLYPISFVAEDSSGQIIAKQTVTINLNAQNQNSTQTVQSAPDSVAAATLLATAVNVSSATLQTNTTSATVAAQHQLDIWWPVDGVTVSGTEPFKAMVEGINVSDYQMFWQVDGQTLNIMDNSSQDYPHKESDVNVDQFAAVAGNKHTLNFVVKDLNNNFVQQKSVTIYTNYTAPTTNYTAPTASNTQTSATIGAGSSTAAVAPVTTMQTAQVTSPVTVTQTAPSQPTALPANVSDAYNQWKSKYVTASGAGGYIRVQRPENGSDTVSEGQGYGMLAALAANDKSTFDNLWNYTRSHLNGNGLMGWHVNSSNQMLDSGAATDADEDIAYALVGADKKWGGYASAAKAMVSSIYSHEIEQPSNIVKPGDVWGGSDAINISYFAPAYYKTFASYTGNSGWNAVVDKGYEIISLANNSSTGLVPDWTNASGGSSSYYMGPNQNNFFYDAIRTPLRLAMDAKWYGDSRAKNQLNKMSNFFAGIGASSLRSGYTLSGSPLTSYFDDTFTSCIAAGASQSSNSSFASAMNTAMNNNVPGSYFGTSLRLVSLMFVNGQLNKN